MEEKNIGVDTVLQTVKSHTLDSRKLSDEKEFDCEVRSNARSSIFVPAPSDFTLDLDLDSITAVAENFPQVQDYEYVAMNSQSVLKVTSESLPCSIFTQGIYNPVNVVAVIQKFGNKNYEIIVNNFQHENPKNVAFAVLTGYKYHLRIDGLNKLDEVLKDGQTPLQEAAIILVAGELKKDAKGTERLVPQEDRSIFLNLVKEKLQSETQPIVIPYLQEASGYAGIHSFQVNFDPSKDEITYSSFVDGNKISSVFQGKDPGDGTHLILKEASTSNRKKLIFLNSEEIN
jgi:hypothetical protein